MGLTFPESIDHGLYTMAIWLQKHAFFNVQINIGMQSFITNTEYRLKEKKKTKNKF